MNERSQQTLELPKILERLADNSSFSAGRELAMVLRPATDLMGVRLRIEETSEGRRLLELQPSVGIGGAHDIRPLVGHAAMAGRLEPSQLLEVMSTLQSGRVLRRTITRLEDQLSILAGLAQRIVECPRLEGEIARCISEQAEVVTEASPALTRTRANLRTGRERLLTRLAEILNSAALRPMIQEPIITQRNGRHVIPVKVEFKGQFRGIVHDQSASGATLFIEPLATVELNNRVRELELAEEHEVDRILRELSSLVAADGTVLEGNVDTLAALDLALAKARLANQMRAVPPALADEERVHSDPTLILRQARHPLLGERVVPISVWLGGEFRTLVITGPNTGGKTVALKTVGLLSLMAQCGLHIPADEGSRIPVFDEVYADIGDEQSIEQSLSTFSSHMRTVVSVLRQADARSLVLLDELGAGTDPEEGSALAQAVLDYLRQRGAIVIATTHYSELKAYAHSTEGVENASVEFDVATLTPTYRLSIGIPGRSNALAIARRLGVPEEVVAAAQARMHPDAAAVEELLSQIQEERDRAKDDRRDAENRRLEADRLQSRLKERLARIEAERAAVIADAVLEARQAAEREIAAVREELHGAMGALEPAARDREALLAALRATQRAERALEQRRDDERAKHHAEKDTPAPLAGAPRVGDLVLVKSLNQQGELLNFVGETGEAEVQAGAFKLRVRASELQRLGRARSSKPEPQSILFAENRPPVPVEIEVRGWRAEDVPPVVDQYVHDAYLAGLSAVRIIHGKGTGVLRRLVREQLSGNPMVRSLRQPEPRDGGEGVTIVELNN